MNQPANTTVSPSSSLPGPFCQDEQREFLSLSRRDVPLGETSLALRSQEKRLYSQISLDFIFYSILDRAQNIPTLSLNLLRSKERRLYSEHSLMMGSRVPAMPLPPPPPPTQTHTHQTDHKNLCFLFLCVIINLRNYQTLLC